MPYMGVAILVGTESGLDASGTLAGSVAAEVEVEVDADVDALGLGDGGCASSVVAVAETVGSGVGGPPYIVTLPRLQSASAAGATATSARSAAREVRPIARCSRTSATSAPQNGHAAPTRACRSHREHKPSAAMTRRYTKIVRHHVSSSVPCVVHVVPVAGESVPEIVAAPVFVLMRM